MKLSEIIFLILIAIAMALTFNYYSKKTDDLVNNYDAVCDLEGNCYLEEK